MMFQKFSQAIILFFIFSISVGSNELLAIDPITGEHYWEIESTRTFSRPPKTKKRKIEKLHPDQQLITKYFLTTTPLGQARISRPSSTSSLSEPTPSTRPPVTELSTRTTPRAVRESQASRSMDTLPILSRPAIPQAIPSNPPLPTRTPSQIVATPPSAPIQRTTRAPSQPQRSDYEIQFIRGRDEHISEIVDLIENAENEILIACWKLKFIPPEILSSLMRAKRRGVSLGFFVSEVLNETAAHYFEEFSDEGNDSEEEYNPIFLTKSHAKFVFVDQTQAMFGSFNAFDSSGEEGEESEEDSNSSFLIKGDIPQMWPFYMGLYHAYKSNGDQSEEGFCATAGASASTGFSRNGPYNRSLSGGSKIWFLTNLREHDEFFRLAVRGAQNQVHIYSPFINVSNARRRLQVLKDNLPIKSQLILHTLPRNEQRLRSVVSSIRELIERTIIRVGNFHDKLVIIDDQTLCVSSLNPLSGALDEDSLYKNVEVSIVLQGPRARSLIREYFKQ